MENRENPGVLEERQASLQEEFDRLQKYIDQKEKDLENKEKILEQKSKELEKKEKDLENELKSNREFYRRQLIIPAGIYILMFLTIFIAKGNLLILSLILLVGIIVWIIMTFQFNKSHRAYA